MHFQQDLQDYPIHIKSYNHAPAEMVIIHKANNQLLTVNNSIIVLFDNIIENWQPQNSQEITVENITAIIQLKPEIVLLGVGEKLLPLEYSVLEPFYKHKIPFEIMTTTNACRTYNILASEHRRVIAAMIV